MILDFLMGLGVLLILMTTLLGLGFVTGIVINRLSVWGEPTWIDSYKYVLRTIHESNVSLFQLIVVGFVTLVLSLIGFAVIMASGHIVRGLIW